MTSGSSTAPAITASDQPRLRDERQHRADVRHVPQVPIQVDVAPVERPRGHVGIAPDHQDDPEHPQPSQRHGVRARRTSGGWPQWPARRRRPQSTGRRSAGWTGSARRCRTSAMSSAARARQRERPSPRTAIRFDTTYIPFYDPLLRYMLRKTISFVSLHGSLSPRALPIAR